MKKLFAAAALSVPLLASAQLTNGGVETNPGTGLVNGNWLQYVAGSDTPWGDDLNLATNQPPGLGQSFVYFDVDGPTTGSLTLPVTITTPGAYFFGGWILQTASGQNNPGDVNWTLTLDTASINGNASSTALVPVMNWNNMQGVVNFATAGNHALTFSFTSEPGKTGKDVAVDNFYVTPVPEPESFALMAAGLAALGFLARRRRA
jgi:hypothetical protein